MADQLVDIWTPETEGKSSVWLGRGFLNTDIDPKTLHVASSPPPGHPKWPDRAVVLVYDDGKGLHEYAGKLVRKGADGFEFQQTGYQFFQHVEEPPDQTGTG